MEVAVALLTLTAMEIVLGIDNVVFIAIVTSRLPAAMQARARQIGLGLALGIRVLLLLTISWVMQLVHPVFKLTDLGLPAAWIRTIASQNSPAHAGPTAESTTEPTEPAPHDLSAHHTAWLEQAIDEVSWKDLILIVGGLFLIAKSVHEVHKKMEGPEHHDSTAAASFGQAVASIVMLDVIFSLDSVITAVGMVRNNLPVMIAAIVISMIVMLTFAGRISAFIERHPTMKILALAFLILIGVLLFAEGLGTPVNKGYIYFAMVFALLVEMVNLRVRSHYPARNAGA